QSTSTLSDREGQMSISGKIAYIDLDKKESTFSPIPQEVGKGFLGGRGINMYLLYNHITEGVDALGPANVLIFGPGLLTGVRAPSASRFNVSAKSPITGFLGDSNCGGFWGPELRSAGFDRLVIQGRSPSPVYLWITDDHIEFRDASHLWGLDTIKTQQVLKEELGSQVQVACIGQAGENMVRFACVMHGYKDAAGRTGMGAVMGSKNLKAIAVRGTGRIEVKHPDQLREVHEAISQKMKGRKIFKVLSKYGTSYLLDAHQNAGLLPVKNNQRNVIEGNEWESLGSENLKRHSSKMIGCFGCAIRCKHVYEVPYGPHKGEYSEGPEYFALNRLGVTTGTYDLETVLVAQDLCNRYGLDVASCGAIIGWAMELYQRGIIDEKLTDGLDLTWGNKKVLLEMIDRIAHRKGFGDILAEDGLRASQTIGKNSEYYFVNVKGLSGETDERNLKGSALNLATASRGGDHLRSRPVPEGMGLPQDFLEVLYGGPVSPDPQSYDGKGRMVTATEKWMVIPDLLGICKFLTKGFLSPNMLDYEDYAELTNAAADMNITPVEMETCAERVITLERMFNIREGLTRKHDTVPERFFEEKSTNFGSMGGNRIDRDSFNLMLDEYYKLHGWDQEGVPTAETIERLDLDKEPSHSL
ncbi:MAG: aldehyde ferredoxin oxidoreductase family protein, partial [Chloroflexota bacterium]|nr:aldehyde ferredoxin oxidoreductase family protein [Chloroflexota bacterium]